MSKKLRVTLDKKEATGVPHPKRKPIWAYSKDRVAHDTYNKLFRQQRLQKRQERRRQ